MKKFLLSILCCMLAVFSMQAEEVTYTVTSTSAVTAAGDVLSGSSAKYSSTYTNNKCQLTKNNSMTLTLSGYAGCKITGITMSMKSNKSSGSGNFSMVAGETTLSSIATTAFSNNAWNGAYTQDYVDVTPTMSNADYTIADGENVVITIAATVNSLYCQSFTITYEGNGSESGGETPEPEPEEPKVGYTLVTSINDLSAGDNVVIVATNANVALSTTQNSNNRGKASVTKSDNIVTFDDDVQVMTLEVGKASGTFAFNTGGGYLCAASSSSNYLRTETTLSENSSWDITIASTGVATIKAQGTYTRNWLRYNSQSSIFSCYGSGQGDVSIYKLYEEGETPAETVDAPILPESTTFKGSMLVEITGIAADATVYYTTDESDPTTSATRVEYTEPFEITATTTVKAVAVNEVGASEVVTKIYTLFVVEETTGYYIKVVSAPADWSGKYLIVYEEGTDAYVFNGKDEANGYVYAVTDGDVIKANSEIDAVAVTIAAMEGGYSVKTANGYIYGVSGSNKLNTNASEPQLNTIEFTADGVNIEAGRYLRFNSAKGDMRFRYYNLTYGESVQLYKYVEELPFTHTLTVSEAGYATLFLGFNARIPSAVEAYTVTTVNDGWVSLTQVTGVLPSNQGVIIKAPAGEYKLFNEATATADVTGNLLEGTLFNKNINKEAYVLGQIDGEVGLYKAKMTDGVWLNNANKAYLPASEVPNKSVAFYGFDWDGTTGIEQITDNRVQSTAIYDLTGRRIEAITAPGIYVVNGKKVLVK